jgi:hypothetical protein
MPSCFSCSASPSTHGRATYVALTPAGRTLIHELRRLEESVLSRHLFDYLDGAAVRSVLDVWHRVPWLTVDVTQVGDWTAEGSPVT